ncbi:MAG: hypothetical protein WBP45_08715 [Daejeonella sp.]
MTIWEFEAFLKSKARFEKSQYKYTAFFLTGKFEGNTDYGRGFLEVTIYIGISEKNPGCISISNIDDGVWQAFAIGGVLITEELAKDVIEQVFNPLNGILPTEKDLNEKLMVFGLWGEFTG